MVLFPQIAALVLPEPRRFLRELQLRSITPGLPFPFAAMCNGGEALFISAASPHS